MEIKFSTPVVRFGVNTRYRSESKIHAKVADVSLDNGAQITFVFMNKYERGYFIAMVNGIQMSIAWPIFQNISVSDLISLHEEVFMYDRNMKFQAHLCSERLARAYVAEYLPEAIGLFDQKIQDAKKEETITEDDLEL